MKKIVMSVLLSMALFGFATAQDNGGRKWLTRYNIDPMNSNPVFTRPDHERDESRVQGAGICMNDGLAYNRRYYGFGSEWHYEPKLILCKEEVQSLPRLFGVYNPEHNENIGQLLKYGVVPTDFGAIVAYRLWTYDRGNRDGVLHYFATYDHKGNLLDCFMAGYPDWLGEILSMEPHGNYKPLVNMGRSNVTISDDNKSLSIDSYYLYHDMNDKSLQLDDSLVYNISPEGLFSVASSYTTGMPDVNKDIMELVRLERLPLSCKDAAAQWNAFAKRGLANEKLKDRVADGILKLFVSRPEHYMAFAANHQKESVLVGSLKAGFDKLASYRGGGAVQMLVEETLENCKDAKVKKYWQNLKLIRSVMSGDF